MHTLVVRKRKLSFQSLGDPRGYGKDKTRKRHQISLLRFDLCLNTYSAVLCFALLCFALPCFTCLESVVRSWSGPFIIWHLLFFSFLFFFYSRCCPCWYQGDNFRPFLQAGKFTFSSTVLVGGSISRPAVRQHTGQAVVSTHSGRVTNPSLDISLHAVYKGNSTAARRSESRTHSPLGSRDMGPASNALSAWHESTAGCGNKKIGEEAVGERRGETRHEGTSAAREQFPEPHHRQEVCPRVDWRCRVEGRLLPSSCAAAGMGCWVAETMRWLVGGSRRTRGPDFRLDFSCNCFSWGWLWLAGAGAVSGFGRWGRHAAGRKRGLDGAVFKTGHSRS